MTPGEIRTRIVDVVMRNGGHLASSLGAVAPRIEHPVEGDGDLDRDREIGRAHV